MPIRTIKPQFFRSRKLARVSRDARLTLIGLWVEADGHGRGSADCDILKGAVWPLDPDITADVIGGHLSELVEQSQIVLYEVDGDPFYEVDSWSKHQAANYRRGEPQHPSPDEGVIMPLSGGEVGETPGQTLFARKSVQLARKSVLEGKGREGKGNASEHNERFDAWWERYPKKVGKKAARRAWQKLSGPEADAAIEALPQHCRYWDGKLTPPGAFVPNPPDPATWLNGHRWEDSLGTVERHPATFNLGGANVARGAFG